ncbi:MAG: hypothetical protein IPK79_03640 [Vampirovibrionales bacterium]|nr:hypothetical protein [Vampirovibrionales bacterium]
MRHPRFWLSLTLVIAALALLSGLAQLAKGPPPGEGAKQDDPSVFSARPQGALGWREAMARSGMPVGVWRDDFQTLLRQSAEAGSDLSRIALVIVAPSGSAFSAPHERDASRQAVREASFRHRLIRWIAEGHTLIWLDNFASLADRRLLKEMTGLIPQPVALARASQGTSDKTGHQMKPDAATFRREFTLSTPADAPAALTRFVAAPVRTRSAARLQPSRQSRILLRDDVGRAVMMETPLGKGRVIVASAPDLVSNRYLMDTGADNLQFMANVLTREGKPVWINEYVHGYQQAPNLLSYYMRTPLAGSARLLLLLALLGLWAAARPWRPVRMPDARASAAERAFADSLAWHYRKTQSPELALGPQIRALAQVLRARYRLDMRALEDENAIMAVFDALARPAAPRLLATLRAIGPDSPPMPGKTLLGLSQQISRLQETLDHGPRFRRDVA